MFISILRVGRAQRRSAVVLQRRERRKGMRVVSGDDKSQGARLTTPGGMTCIASRGCVEGYALPSAARSKVFTLRAAVGHS